MSVIGMAHQTNSLSTLMKVPVDQMFRVGEDESS
jgi:hypothetical protein